MKTLVLTRADVRALLTMEQAVPAVEGAFAAHGRGETLMPAKVYLSFKEGGDFRAMPSAFGDAAGIKWVNAHPQNPSRHQLPTVMGLYILSDPATGLPLAVMDATLLTAVRTGAAGGVASKHLAEKPKTLGFVGCGVQARFLLAAHRVVFGALDLCMADASPEAAAKFAAEAGGRAVSLEEASACDIVCTSTPSTTPVVKDAWVKPRAHVNAMGADAAGKQELETALVKRAKIVIDDVEQATHSGEINVPLHDGALKVQDIYATLGEIIAGKKPRPAAGLTIFDSTGLAIQDLALARVVYEAARSAGRGAHVDFLD